MKKIYALSLFLLIHVTVMAQTAFTITGQIKNVKGEPIESATVFIDGSKQITKSDNTGTFKFYNLSAGTYQVVINMIGYKSEKRNVIISTQSASISLAMQEKQLMLAEVVIGNNSKREQWLAIFLKNFLGLTPNAEACKITNTDIIDFSTNKNFIEAQTEDFLEIENPSLGYTIKYLLRAFRYNQLTGITSFDGELIFQEMTGSAQQIETWKENRKDAYLGSFMHFIRAVYAGKTQQENYTAYEVMNSDQPMKISNKQFDIPSATIKSDTALHTLKFKRPLYVMYNKPGSANSEIYDAVFRLFLENAQIDAKGSYVDYKSFFLQGYWARRRFGDQLPFEYQLGD